MESPWSEQDPHHATSLHVPPQDYLPSNQHRSSSSSRSRDQRAVSTAIQSSSQSNQSSSRRHRASHQITSDRERDRDRDREHNGPSSNQPAFDIKQHPAALAYAAAHPGRNIPKFGPYLLLQTLGEGEFGKVKLGLNSQWGEEVAVKLIRRGNIDSSVRMSKIEREIEVLRSLNHPNIVRLYDVIETDKYIGIILEYASGGELFDYILAHRYLKEKDACKLFAQLISAVWYIHQKKIVHRDLKLENLLLDRHRNVIVTDFGFANRFEHRADDLMQTSCGSPCYAAPELVISEGLYVGSAVDIWSCGVILYAMLAGYLPFDDDPANPEGDNINLLYKYILSTQLTFPDYVSPEARDLLGKMLVPDPQYRADLRTVMEHPWLSPYSELFDRSIPDVESMATQAQEHKRAAYAKQIREREREAARAARAQKAATAAARSLGESDHHIGDRRPTRSTGFAEGHGNAALVAEPDVYMAPTPHSNGTRGGRVVTSAIIMPTPPPEPEYDVTMKQREDEDDRASRKEQSRKKSGKEGGKKAAGGGFRHTIQVEYDDGGEGEAPPPTPSKGSRKRKEEAMNGGETSEVDVHLPIVSIPPLAEASPSKRTKRDSNASKQSVPALPPAPVSTPPATAFPSPPPASYPSPVRTRGSSTSPTLVRNVVTEPVVPTYQQEAEESESSQPSTVESTPAATPTSNGKPSPIIIPLPSPSPSPSIEAPPGKPSRHGRGMSIDRFGFSKLLHGKDSTGESGVDRTQPQRKPSETSSANGSVASATGSTNSPTTASGLSGAIDSGSVKSSSKKRGGKALSLVVDPIARMKESRAKSRGSSLAIGSDKDKTLQTPLSAQPSALSPAMISPAVPPKGEASLPPTTPSWGSPFKGAKAAAAAASPVDPLGNGMISTTGASSKSQSVMDWFRKKSLAKERRRAGSSEEVARADGAKTPTQEDPQEKDAKTPTASSFADAQAHGPSVVVTSDNGSIHSGSQGSKTKKRDPLSSAIQNAIVPPSSIPLSSSKNRGYNRLALRPHDGPVDTSTLSSAPPQEIVAHVLGILGSLGIEYVKESEYKYRCVRPKRKKAGMVVREPSSSTSGIAAFNSVGTAASNGVDRRGLPVAGNSFGQGAMLKFFSRRISSQPSPSSTSSSSNISLSFDTDTVDVGSSEPSTPPGSTPSHHSASSTIIEPIYGGPPDQGDEVRFSVEVTRIDRLEDLLSLDIRRLKGHLKSYKFLYDTIRERCNLPQ